jgi:hypothetical protein
MDHEATYVRSTTVSGTSSMISTTAAKFPLTSHSGLQAARAVLRLHEPRSFLGHDDGGTDPENSNCYEALSFGRYFTVSEPLIWRRMR